MKKSLMLLIILFIAGIVPVSAQKSGLLKKVTKAMTDELLGTTSTSSSSTSTSNQPEPACACNDAEVVMDMGGKLTLDYKELSFSVSDDGRILAKDAHMNEYYIVKAGITRGPYKPGDPDLAGFQINAEDIPEGVDPWVYNYKEYISKSGDKYVINFGGKSYGPYGMIQNFAVTRSKDKFAAIVVENIVTTEDQGKKMEEAMKNAKTDQERMDLAMQFSQQMAQNVMDAGGAQTMTPKLVSNISGATYDPLSSMGGTLSATMKYDDILVYSITKIIDLQGKTILTVKPEHRIDGRIFVNTANTKYAVEGYGNITFNDNTTLSDIFGPHLVKADGKVYLAYMYYSPKKNSLMQCKIPF